MSDPTDPSRNPQRDFAVGLTVLVALVVFAVLIVSFAGIKGLIKGGYDINITLPRAQGLPVGSQVSLAGIPIGSVVKVSADKAEDGSFVIHAVARIDQGYTLPDTARVELNEQILGGVARLIIFADKPALKGALAKDGSATLTGRRSNLAIEMADNIMGGAGADSGVGGLVADTRGMILSLKKTTDLIGSHFEPVDPKKLASGEAPPNIQTLIVRMNSLVSHTDEVVADPRMREDLRATLAAAKEAATHANEAITSASGTISELGKKIGLAVDGTSGEAKTTMTHMRDTLGTLQTKYGTLADELNKTTAEVNSLLAAINSGKGTAGKLVHDPALYENLNDAAQRLDKAFEDVRQLVEKFKKEGVDLKLK